MSNTNIPTPHIACKDEALIAKTVLLPGDPLRAKFIADTFLTDVVCFNTVRNMFGYTGKYNGKLISVMGFGVPRYKKDGFELHRYCVKSGITVLGGASRLLKAFEKEYSPKELLSYSNNDYFTGDIYNKLGFNNDGQTNIDYFWATNTGYFKRSECQPKTLKNRYSELYQDAIYNNAGSKEVYIMTKLGARKVFRCGNTRWIKKY